MKKTLLMACISLFFLSGCQSLRAAIKGEDNTANTNQALTAKTKEAAEIRLKELNKVDFPQLDKTVGKDEAQVRLLTSEGDITIKLFPKYAPLAVENFLTHAKAGYYNGLTFHRVIKDFMIQSGDPKGDGTGGQSIWSGKDDTIDAGDGFQNEVSDYLYNLRGALAMANRGAHTNGSQFYIVQNQDDMSRQLNPAIYPEKIISAYKEGGYPQGDGNYTVFGQVIDGMAVIDKIAQTQTDTNDKPTKAITITSIEVLKDYTFTH